MEKNNKIGSVLKKKRESKKLTIQEVASKTKINLSILKRLEASDINALPNKTYVKGFVKSYAKLIDLDQAEAILCLENTYSNEKEIQNDQNKEIDIEKSPQKENKAQEVKKINEQTKQSSELQEKIISFIQSIFKKKVLFTLIAVVVIIVVIKAVVSFIGQLTNEQKMITTEKFKDQMVITKPIIMVNTDVTIKDKDQNLFDIKASKKFKEDLAKENDEKAKLIAETKAKEEAKKIELEKEALIKKDEAKKLASKKEKLLKLNGKFPFVKFYPAPTSMFKILENAPENKNRELLPNRFKNSIQDGTENVYIHATSGDTWISYQTDDNDIKRFVLKKGRSVLIKGKTILLFTGNVNVAHIFYNNKLIKAFTKTGVKSLIFPQERASELELPLFPSYKGIPYKASIYKENMATSE